MPNLYERLQKLKSQPQYPFHMPGHKRNPGAGPMAGIMSIDISEIEGFDDLHDASGILREAQERAARLYGAEESYFLVNGSTAGVLAAVSAVCGRAAEQMPASGGTGHRPQAAAESGGGASPLILAGRGSHQSVLHGLYLNRAEASWLFEAPVADEEARRLALPCAEIPGVVSPMQVMEALAAAASAGRLPAAVVLTSPNYYGVTADVPSIVEIAHSYQVPVVVDQAHGAHLGFGYGMPDSAVRAGADLVIMSTHKTLPALTQTALLHVRGRLVDRDRLRRFLRIYQSSSPSYVLMASIDTCMEALERNPDALLSRPGMYKRVILEQSRRWRCLRVLSEQAVPDPCKVVVSTAGTPMTGQELYHTLIENYHIHPEMAGEDTVVFILTGMDTEEGLEALLWSLSAVDGILAQGGLGRAAARKTFPRTDPPEIVCSIAAGWDAPSEEVPLAEAADRIAAAPVIPYPPGVPLLVPGERVDEAMRDRILALSETGYKLRGVQNGRIRVTA